MADLTISFDVVLPLLKQRNSKVSGQVNVPVQLRRLEKHEETMMLHVAAITTNNFREQHFNVYEFEDALWRNVPTPLYGNNPDQSPAENLVRRMSHELTRIPNRHERSYSEAAEVCNPSLIDQNLLFAAAADMEKAAQDLMIVGDNVFRRCHEPTWLVSKDKTVNSNIVSVQPSLAAPRSNHAWFSADRLEDALAFAHTIAADIDGEVLQAGTIELGSFYHKSFDDVLHAQNTFLDMYQKSLKTLAASYDDDAMDDFLEASLKIKAYRSHSIPDAIDLTFETEASLKCQFSHLQSVQALLEASKLVSDLVKYNRVHVLTATDEAALDALTSLGST